MNRKVEAILLLVIVTLMAIAGGAFVSKWVKAEFTKIEQALEVK